MSQSVYCTTYWDIPEEGNDTFVSSYRQECTIQSDQLGFMQVPIVLSILIGLPLNITIIQRLLQKKLNNLCRYHWFIIAQCFSDMAFTLDHLVIAILNTQKCTFAPMAMSMLMLLSDVLLSAQHISICVLSIYWKSILRPQNALDRFFYLVIFIAFGLIELGCKLAMAYNNLAKGLHGIAEDTIRSLSTYISLLLNCSIAIVIYNFMAVTFWNTSNSSPIIKKSHRKMSTSLLLQAFLVFFIALITQLFIFSVHNATCADSPMEKLHRKLANETKTMETTTLGYGYGYGTYTVDSANQVLINQIRKEEEKVVFMLNTYSKINFLMLGILPFLKVLLMWWSIKRLIEKTPKLEIKPPSKTKTAPEFKRASL